VVRKGDTDAGAILVKINRRERGCIVLNRVQDQAGALVCSVPRRDAGRRANRRRLHRAPSRP